jgi:hypothetical protein
MLDGLFRGAVADVVHDVLDACLAAADPLDPPRVAVVGDVALGRALVAQYKRALAAITKPAPPRKLTIVVAPGSRAGRKLEDVIVGTGAKLPVEDQALAALVGVGGLGGAEVSPVLREWLRAVKEGGTLVLVDRVPPTTATRHALCAGLTEIEQRSSGRAVVTSGTVIHWLDGIAQKT